MVLVVVLSACGGAKKPEPTAVDSAAASKAAADKEARQLFEEGKQAFARGEMDVAIAKWEAGYAAKPTAEFQFNLAQAELKAERPDKAAEHLRKYLQEAPKATNRAEVESALKDIDAAAVRAESQKLFDAGKQSFKDGKYDEAIAQWEAGYAKAPSAAFLYNIGQAQVIAGKKAEAQKTLQRYLEAAPDSPNRADVEKQIKQLEPRSKKK